MQAKQTISSEQVAILEEALRIGAARWIAVPGEWKPFPPTIDMVVNDWKTAAEQKISQQQEEAESVSEHIDKP